MKRYDALSTLETLCKKTHKKLRSYLIRHSLLIFGCLILMTIELGVFLYFFFSQGKPWSRHFV